MKLQSTIKNTFTSPKTLIIGMFIILCAYCITLGVVIGSGKQFLAIILLGFPVLCLAGVIFNRYFHTLVFILPIVAMVLPRLELPTGTETKLPLSLLLTLALMAIWFIHMWRYGFRTAFSPINAPILVFCVVCIISLVWGIIWRDPILIKSPTFIVTQIGSLLTILASCCVPLLIGNFFQQEKHLLYLVSLFIVLGTIMTIILLLNIDAFLLNSRGLWATWVIACGYGLLIAQPKMPWHYRIPVAISIILTFYFTLIINREWISGWFPSIVAVLAITFLHSWKAFLTISAAGVAVVIISWGFFTDIAQSNIDTGSLERLIIWQQNWQVVSQHWLFGTGPAGYAIYYMSYFPEEARSTHNNYLDILAQFGFVGMAVWLWLMVISVWEGWSLVKKLPIGFPRSFAITGGWIGALSSMLFGDWVLPFAYNQGIAGFKYTVYSWFFLGVLISLRRFLPNTAVLHQS
jgi:O-antigen ligase